MWPPSERLELRSSADRIERRTSVEVKKRKSLTLCPKHRDALGSGSVEPEGIHMVFMGLRIYTRRLLRFQDALHMFIQLC
jgi:hypothetical protein